MKGYKKGGLAKPTLEEVREYFKDAKVVQDIYGDVADITEDLEQSFHYNGYNIWVTTKTGLDVIVWRSDNGYSKIIEYKSKQKPMKKVIRLDEPKEESKKPIELIYHHRSLCNYHNSKNFDFSTVKEIIYLGNIDDLGDMFRVEFNDKNGYFMYSGHLNDGVY